MTRSRSLRRTVMLACAMLAAASAAQAGGPLVVRTNGLPFVWSTASAINYRTDSGPLSSTVNEAAMRGRVANSFNVWQNVNTASIAYTRAGFINATGAFAGGDINTIDEYDAVESSCFNGTQSPIVYDANGSITTALGLDQTAIIGFAGPCALNPSQILTGRVTMNGLFQDGAGDDLTAAEFDAAIVHEIGHFSNLDHSQINANCVDAFCDADDQAGLPTMLPFLLIAGQGSLAVDDIAWISRLHPQTTGVTTFAGTHGTITGTVRFSDGETHAQSVNVIARRVDAGGNEDRRIAVSVVSGFKFTDTLGSPILPVQPSSFGSTAPGDVGLFEIPVPAGSYTVELESIHPIFVDSSTLGPYAIAMPGSAPPPSGVVVVAAGATVPVGNFVLIGTAPRFDQFEGP